METFFMQYSSFCEINYIQTGVPRNLAINNPSVWPLKKPGTSASWMYPAA